MLIAVIIGMSIGGIVVVAVVFGPHRTSDVLSGFGYAIQYLVLFPFRLASALYARLRRKETAALQTIDLHLLLATMAVILFGVPYLVLRLFGFFKDDESSDEEAGEGQSIAIGEAVVLQTSWKEPPFAITVLGRPERIEGDRERVRVPVRYTGIVHRWPHFSAGGYPALMHTRENDAGERIGWESEYENQWAPEFEDFSLVEGGTYERYLYFRAGEDEEQKTVPRRRFIELTWMDDSETVITVDLRSDVPPAERIRFRDGVPERRPDKSAFEARLRMLGSQWAGLSEAPVAGIGDVVKVAVVPGGKERWEVTALGGPVPIAEDIIRLPLRVTSRFREARHFDDDLLSIGTTPDEFGVILHLWEPRDFKEGRGRPEDCLHGAALQRNETREGAVYFSPSERGKPKEPPTEPFTTLWYGVNFMEMPVSLRANGQRWGRP